MYNDDIHIQNALLLVVQGYVTKEASIEELEIFIHLAQGKDAAKIARLLGKNEKTVREICAALEANFEIKTNFYTASERAKDCTTAFTMSSARTFSRLFVAAAVFCTPPKALCGLDLSPQSRIPFWRHHLVFLLFGEHVNPAGGQRRAGNLHGDKKPFVRGLFWRHGHKPRGQDFQCDGELVCVQGCAAGI